MQRGRFDVSRRESVQRQAKLYEKAIELLAQQFACGLQSAAMGVPDLREKCAQRENVRDQAAEASFA